jgi:hypothetical protein
MNTSFLAIIKRITAEQGEGILGDAARLKSFIKDYAQSEPQPLRLAFGRAVEAGAYNALKSAPSAAERASRKAAIAQNLHNNYWLDPALCAEALDILEAALTGGGGGTPPPQYQQSQYQQSAQPPQYQAPPPQYQPPPAAPQYPPQYQQPQYQPPNQQYYQGGYQAPPQGASPTSSLWTTVLVLNILGLNFVSRFLTGHILTGVLILVLDIATWCTFAFGIGWALLVAGLVIWVLDLIKIATKKWQTADGTYLVP